MKMTKKTLLAVSLIIEGNSYLDTAQQCGISIRALSKWRATPEFQALIQAHQEKIEQELWTTGIANRVARQMARQQRWSGVRRVIDERKKDPRYQNEPGGNSGLLRRDIKTVAGKPVALFVVDKALLSVAQALEDSAAHDQMQPSSPADSVPPQSAAVDYTLLSDEQLAELRKIAHSLEPAKESK